MKPFIKSILLVASILASSRMAAQPTLNALNTNPVVGEHFYTYWCDTSLISPTLTGAGVTWNYGSMSILFADTTDVVACASTPYCDSFTGSTFAEYLHSGHSYRYFDAGTTALTVTGAYYPSPGPCINYYPMPYNFFVYPFTYGTSQIDSFIYTVPCNYQISYVRDTTVADGYGTLILPTGTYTNVLRIKHKFWYRHVSTLSGSTWYASEVWYTWSKPGTHEPLLWYMDNDKDEVGTIKGPKAVNFTTAVPLGVEEYDAKHAIDIYPNPASGVVHVKGLQNNLTTELVVIDVTGRNVNAPVTLQGSSEMNIHTDALADGLYLIRIQTDGGVVLHKLEVLH